MSARCSTSPATGRCTPIRKPAASSSGNALSRKVSFQRSKTASETFVQLLRADASLRLGFDMRDGRASLRVALFCAVGFALCGAVPVSAQEWSGKEGSTTAGPSLDDYMKDAGSDAKIVAHE